MKKRISHVSCSVVDCQTPHTNVFVLPQADQAIRDQWFTFIFNGAVPETLPTVLGVCANHFKPECFINLGQYQAKMASRIRLERGAIPSVRSLPAIQTASTSQAVPGTSTVISSKVRHIGCQTTPLVLASTGTQLSLKTLSPHVRSVGTQARTVKNTSDVGICTLPDTFSTVHPWSSMPNKPPMKRRHLIMEQEENEASTSEAPEAQDSLYNPKDSADVLTESMETLTGTGPSPVKSSDITKMRKLLVFEQCLMELFEKCPVCSRVCDVQKKLKGVFIAVWQRCPHCHYQKQWKSQPVIGHSTPAGSLQLSTAICVSGDSFFNMQKQIIADKDESSGSEVPEIVHCVGEEDDGDSDISGDPCDRDSDDDWDPDSEDELFDAVQTDSEESSDDIDDDNFSKSRMLCPDCGKLCAGGNEHTCEHKKKPYSCIHCGKRFQSESALKRHDMMHNGTYEYHCKYCFVKYKTMADKIGHEQSHVTEEMPFKCPECSEKFATYREQTTHIRNHKAVKCDVCGFEFREPNALKRHIAVHTGEKPFTCVVCKRGFKQMSHLNSHLRMHTGEKPFACQLCDKRFNHNVSLKGHLKSHHAEEGQAKKRGRRRAGARANGSEAGDDDATKDQDTDDDVQMEEKLKRMVKGRPIGRPKKKTGSSVKTERKRRRGSNAEKKKRKCEEIIEDVVH